MTWYDASEGAGGTKVFPVFSLGGAVSSAIPLSFSFTFYGVAYSQVYVSTNGVLSFNSATTYTDLEYNKPLPLAKYANNLIAPLWGSIFPLDASDITYRTVDDPAHAGYKIFVVEWNIEDLGSSLTFEAQLFQYESGIAFAYSALDAALLPAAYSVGIEDAAGQIGLQYPNAVNVSTKLFITRPAAGPRGNLLPRYNGALTSSGAATLPLRLTNNGDWGNDVYNMTLVSSDPAWQATLYNASTGSTLIDTNHDGVIDTGAMAKGSTRSLLLRVVAPLGAEPGDDTRVTVTATSVAAPTKKVSSYIDASVPSEFALVFVDAGVEFRQVWKENIINRTMDTAFTGTTFSMEAATPDKYLVAWEELGAVTADGRVLRGVKLLPDGRMEHQGRLLAPEDARPFTDIPYRMTHVTNGPGVVRSLTNVQQILLADPNLLFAHASAPAIEPVNNLSVNGYILAAWKLNKTNSAYQTNANLYLTVMNSAGDAVLAQPYNVTNDAAWNSNARQYKEYNLVALENGRYAMCWIDGATDTIRCTFFQLTGSALTRVVNEFALADGFPAGFDPLSLNMTAVTEDSLLLAYTAYDGDKGYRLYYRVINSNGADVQPETLIAGADGLDPRTVQIADDRALLVWTQVDGRLYYARIDHNTIAGGFPDYFERTYERAARYPSVAVNKAGYTIITWVDGDAGEYIYYSLLDNAANVITSPLSMVSNPFGNPTYINSKFGFGSARYSGVYLNILPYTSR